MGTKTLTYRQKGGKVEDLLDTEKIFCAEYLANGRNGKAAAKVAFPNVTSASRQAQVVMARPRVQKYLSRMTSKVLDKAELTAEMAIRKLVAIFNADVMDLYEPGDIDGVYRLRQLDDIPEELRRCITSIESKTTENEFGVHVETKIKLMSKDEALQLAMKYLGMLRENSVNVNMVNNNIDFDKLCQPLVVDDEVDVIEGRILGTVQVVPEVAKKDDSPENGRSS